MLELNVYAFDPSNAIVAFPLKAAAASLGPAKPKPVVTDTTFVDGALKEATERYPVVVKPPEPI